MQPVFFVGELHPDDTVNFVGISPGNTVRRFLLRWIDDQACRSDLYRAYHDQMIETRRLTVPYLDRPVCPISGVRKLHSLLTTVLMLRIRSSLYKRARIRSWKAGATACCCRACSKGFTSPGLMIPCEIKPSINVREGKRTLSRSTEPYIFLYDAGSSFMMCHSGLPLASRSISGSSWARL